MIAITGTTGIVGSHIALQLLKRGESLRLLKRPQSSTRALDQLLGIEPSELPGTYEWIDGDVNDPVSLRGLIKGVNRIYHCAAMVSFHPKDHDAMMETNVLGTRNVVDQCLNHGVALTYISSTAAIGDQSRDGVYYENSPWTTDKGRSAYSLSKRAAELEVFRGVEEGLNAAVVNPGVIIGPGKWGESSTTIVLSARKGIPFYPTGANGFVDVRDVAGIAIALGEKENVTGRHLLIGENLSFYDLFAKITSAFGRPSPRFKMSSSLAAVAKKVLAFLEAWNLSPFNMTSENLKSAYSHSTYSNAKVRELGFTFRTVDDAIAYTKKVLLAQ